MNRLEKQVKFLKEVDKLKNVYRQSYLLVQNRSENSAEHSWHVALMALMLAEYSEQEINLERVIKMMLIHDLVEIDAGDTYCYDEKGLKNKVEREKKAAKRIFGLLPADQHKELQTLWQEFETQQTPEAIFAASLDRLMPILHNYFTNGKSWKEHKITKSQVLERNTIIKKGSRLIWKYTCQLISSAVEKGYLINK